MEDSDKQVFAQALAALAETFGRPPMNREQLRLWWFALSGLTVDQLQHAIGQAVRDCEFMPSPAVIRRLAIGDHAKLAWERVVHAIEDAGEYGSVRFDDPVIGQAIKRIGGWRTLCRADDFGFAQSEKKFLDTYNRLDGTHQENLAMVGLHGNKPKRIACEYLATKPAIAASPIAGLIADVADARGTP